jgi:hypothetical protein
MVYIGIAKIAFVNSKLRETKNIRAKTLALWTSRRQALKKTVCEVYCNAVVI